MWRPNCLLAAAVLLALGVIGLAVPGTEPPRPAVPAASVVASPAREPVEVVLKRGETMEIALRRGGVERGEALAVVAGLRGSVNMRRLTPGERLLVSVGPDGKPAQVTYWRSPAEQYEAMREEDGWAARAIRPEVETRVVSVAGELRDSLFASMDRLGESANLTARLVSLFEWDFDFAADSLPGDGFRLLVEKRYVDGAFLGYGNILIAQYASAGRSVLTSVAFVDGTGRTDYYDAAGRSIRKMFLRAPLDFTRITSGFSHARRHPILGGVRPHLAVDYGAPVGTPVRAVAGGMVTAAGWNGGNGLSIQIRHARGYETMYNHLSKVEVRRGERVRQRQIIGRVGSTGLSTGPHLDYRVRKGGVWVNPLSEKFIPGAPVSAHRREAFTIHVRTLLERLDQQAPLTPRTASTS